MVPKGLRNPLSQALPGLISLLPQDLCICIPLSGTPLVKYLVTSTLRDGFTNE